MTVTRNLLLAHTCYLFWEQQQHHGLSKTPSLLKQGNEKAETWREINVGLTCMITKLVLVHMPHGWKLFKPSKSWVVASDDHYSRTILTASSARVNILCIKIILHQDLGVSIVICISGEYIIEAMLSLASHGNDLNVQTREMVVLAPSKGGKSCYSVSEVLLTTAHKIF